MHRASVSAQLAATNSLLGPLAFLISPLAPHPHDDDDDELQWGGA